MARCCNACRPTVSAPGRLAPSSGPAHPEPARTATATDALSPPDETVTLVEDDVDSEAEPGETEPPPTAELPPHPFVDKSDEEREKMLLEDPASLGPVSVGATNAGALFGGEKMPYGDRWRLVDQEQSWGW